MSETTYTIEYAKSGRSKCKKCKEPIQKGDMRMGVVVTKKDDGGFDMTSYHHVDCFRLPRKFVSGPMQLSPQEFFRDMVNDTTDGGDILPEKLDELAARLEATMASGGSAKKGKAAKIDTSTIMGRLKQALKDEEEGKEKPAKKQRKNNSSKESFERLLDLYREHHKSKSDDLKDYLRWNNQILMGNKEFVLFKVMDGFLHGRLGCCGLCGGKLKMAPDDEDHVYCNGRFDEDNNIRLPCDFKGDRLEAPRFQPWYEQEPTEEEKAEMERLMEEARGEDGDANSSNPDAQALLKEAADMDWKLTDKAGLQSATKALVELVGGKLDLPTNKTAKMTLGPMIVANRDKTPKEIVQEVIDKFGFADQKEKKAAAKEAALESVCSNPKNAALLMAFQELAQLYFKDGNRNAGASYTKVVAVMKGMKQEITAKNAISFSKGKTKIAGIGKGSAEKMKEFCETGSIQKLEEKRAALS